MSLNTCQPNYYIARIFNPCAYQLIRKSNVTINNKRVTTQCTRNYLILTKYHNQRIRRQRKNRKA